MHTKRILPIAFLMVFLLSSCNKWLTISTQDGIVADSYWKSKDDVKAAVMGCYASMLSNDMVERMFLWGELRGDMVTASTKIPAWYYYVLIGEILPNNDISKWITFYQTINYANTVLEYAKQAQSMDSNFTTAELKAYEAEALAVRGLMYFYLLRTFGEVPLVLNATINDEQDLYLAKSSKVKILNQIITDLRTASSNALTTYGTTDQDKGRFTKYGVNALQADVYLWAEQYDSCIVACQKVIDSNVFSLSVIAAQSNIAVSANPYIQNFVSGNTTEGIFELQFSSQQTNPFYKMFDNVYGKRLIANSLRMSDVFISSTESNKYLSDSVDIRNPSYTATDGTIYKLIASITSHNSALSYEHWPIYRYADVLLMKAEALAQRNGAGDIVSSVAIIDDLRTHRLASPDSYQNPDNTKDLTDYILEERSREFCFEGKRWFDLLRNAKRNNYERKDLFTTMITRYGLVSRKQILLSRFADTMYHYLPINQSELDVNTMLVQNPFYLK
jgi:starch-binding outer membrane protein, SusD/RagB family